MGTLKGVGRVYQQTFIDTYAKVGFAKLYDRKQTCGRAIRHQSRKSSSNCGESIA